MEVEKKTVKESTEKKTTKKKVATFSDGVVVCERLNIRQEPKTGDNVIAIAEEGTLLSIDLSFENEEFYKIAGKNAYCMKKFVSLK